MERRSGIADTIEQLVKTPGHRKWSPKNLNCRSILHDCEPVQCLAHGAVIKRDLVIPPPPVEVLLEAFIRVFGKTLATNVNVIAGVDESTLQCKML